jgi:hypothetical protein
MFSSPETILGVVIGWRIQPPQLHLEGEEVDLGNEIMDWSDGRRNFHLIHRANCTMIIIMEKAHPYDTPSIRTISMEIVTTHLLHRIGILVSMRSIQRKIRTMIITTVLIHHLHLHVDTRLIRDMLLVDPPIVPNIRPTRRTPCPHIIHLP